MKSLVKKIPTSRTYKRGDLRIFTCHFCGFPRCVVTQGNVWAVCRSCMNAPMFAELWLEVPILDVVEDRFAKDDLR